MREYLWYSLFSVFYIVLFVAVVTVTAILLQS